METMNPGDALKHLLIKSFEHEIVQGNYNISVSEGNPLFQIHIDPSPSWTKEFKMAISADLQAKLDVLRASVASEAAEVKGAIDELKTQVADLKAQVENGLDQSAIASALGDLQSQIESIYTPDTPVTPAPEAPAPVEPTV